MLVSFHDAGTVTPLVFPGAVEAVRERCQNADDRRHDRGDPASVVLGGFFGLEDQWSEEVA